MQVDCFWPKIAATTPGQVQCTPAESLRLPKCKPLVSPSGWDTSRTGWWVLAMRNLEATLTQQGLSCPAEWPQGWTTRSCTGSIAGGGGFGITWPKLGCVVVVGVANPTSLSELCHSRGRFLSSLAWLLSPQQGHAVLLGAKGIDLTRLAPLLPLTWPDFIDLLCLCCLCSCCSLSICPFALFWLQQPQLFILFACHIQGRCQEELGEGEPWQSVQVCKSECVNTSPGHEQKQAGSSLAASPKKEEEKVPNTISARELLVRELELFPLFRALKNVGVLFKFFTAPLHLQRAEVIFPRKCDVH